MLQPHLMIVCGVPGSGKSTFANRAAERWGASRFASETFADELGDAARTVSGDLSKQAIVHAYSAMAIAVRDTLANNKLVVAVGSFRSDEQRAQFRALAKDVGTNVTTVRIVCSVDTAAERVRSRLADGERGPTENGIRQIEAELNRATGINITVRNDSSLDDFYQKIDVVMQAYATPFCDQNTLGRPNLRSLEF